MRGQRDLRIAVDQAKTKGGNPKVDVAGNPVYYSKLADPSTPKALIRLLSRHKRANLFLANACFEDVQSSHKLTIIPHMKRRVRKLASVAAAAIASHEKAIGAEWSSILHNSHTYSGLNVETLAKLMGTAFQRWYKVIYYFQSIYVHAGAPLGHLRISRMRSRLRSTYHRKVKFGKY